MALNVDQLLAPVSADSPGGESLEYDPAYLELEKLANGTPEQQVGTTIIPPTEPDWKKLREQCMELSKRTRDLRVLTYLAMSLLKLEGLRGLRDGLAALKGNVATAWDSLHPRLDPDDGNDPTERLNILRVFASREPGRAESPMIAMVREAPLVSSVQAGRFGLREIGLANGDGAATGGNGTPVDPRLIEAAARQAKPDELQALLDAARQAAELTRGLEAGIDAQVCAGQGVDFKDFAKTLDQAAAELQKFLALHGIGTPAAPDAGDASARPGSAPRAGSPIAGDIQSTDDVKRMIDKMCAFYARTEPSSPVPILLRRAQRLVGKNFWEILTDLSPAAIDAVKVISGTEGTEAGQG